MCPEPGNKKTTVNLKNSKRSSRCAHLIRIAVIGETSGSSDVDADLVVCPRE